MPDFRGIRAPDAIGSVYTGDITNTECYCLRILLNKIIGPKSVTYLKGKKG